MSSDALVAPCPPSVHRKPPVPGLERSGDVWRLSVARHRELIEDVTGVDPHDSLTLQELTTIAARLEGFVEQRKRHDTSAERPATDHGSGQFTRLWLWLVAVVGSVFGRTTDSDTATQMPLFDSYSTETVWYLSQFFRAAADEQYERVSSDTAVPADLGGTGLNLQ